MLREEGREVFRGVREEEEEACMRGLSPALRQHHDGRTATGRGPGTWPPSADARRAGIAPSVRVGMRMHNGPMMRDTNTTTHARTYKLV